MAPSPVTVLPMAVISLLAERLSIAGIVITGVEG